MIREVCSCGAEFETDHPDQVDLVVKWRKAHKHQPDKPEREDSSITSNTDTSTMGFQPEMPVFKDVS